MPLSKSIKKAQRWLLEHEGLTVLISLFIQVALAIFLGHYFDMRIFMGAGYLAGSGQNPYCLNDLSSVFHSPLFQAVPGIGYPPPYPLLLGMIYLFSFKLLPNLFIYNFAIKIPVIVSNIGLAYLVRWLLKNSGAGEDEAGKAWLFILFNPFILYTTSAWGQFDTAVALLSLASLYFLYTERTGYSAFLLAIAISLKSIALPLFFLSILYTGKRSLMSAFRYLAIFIPAILLFSLTPFLIFGWSISLILLNWNFHFTVAGGMSLFNFFELLENSYQIPRGLEIIGFIWLPALIIGTFAINPEARTFTDLVQKSASLTLIFFLTRAWISEPNINLVLPMLLILSSTGRIEGKSMLLIWVIPLIFTVLNLSLPQLFFLLDQSIIHKISEFDEPIRGIRLLARFLVVIPWHIAGWRIVLKGYTGASR